MTKNQLIEEIKKYALSDGGVFLRYFEKYQDTHRIAGFINVMPGHTTRNMAAAYFILLEQDERKQLIESENVNRKNKPNQAS